MDISLSKPSKEHRKSCIIRSLTHFPISINKMKRDPTMCFQKIEIFISFKQTFEVLLLSILNVLYQLYIYIIYINQYEFYWENSVLIFIKPFEII
ncbi:unnamed protein product [Larinioides sclopetarius]|uniref:Transmembrane protein n=1 Tax=Larinioides sclopetarius TaxID=280406 RepID=A0AAV2AIL6_9ARAC